jgi:hypothetical protein
MPQAHRVWVDRVCVAVTSVMSLVAAGQGISHRTEVIGGVPIELIQPADTNTNTQLNALFA